MAGDELVGVVSRADLLEVRHDPETGDRLTLVSEVMTPLVFAVKASDPILFAAKLMDHERIHRVIVVDDEFRTIGIITAMDVVRALARGMFEGDAMLIPKSEASPGVEWVRLPKAPYRNYSRDGA